MTIRLTFKMTGSIAGDSEFTRELFRRAQLGADVGEKALAKEHLRELVKWETPPTFKSARDVLDAARLYAAKEVEVGGADAWKWILVNYGGPEVNIDLRGTRRIMIFPFQGRGRSYSAKTDGGTGQRQGKVIATNKVSGRQIKPRDLIGRVYDRRSVIFDSMLRAFANG